MSVSTQLLHLTNPPNRYIITPLNKVKAQYVHTAPIKYLDINQASCSKGICIALTKITVKTPDIQNKLPNASKYHMSGENRKGFTCHQYENNILASGYVCFSVQRHVIELFLRHTVHIYIALTKIITKFFFIAQCLGSNFKKHQVALWRNEPQWIISSQK